MGMTTISTGMGDVLNGVSSGLGNPSIGMPYGPGYTDPNQPQGPGDVSIGMPAGPGYMQPSSGGKGGMPAPVMGGPEPVFNFPSAGIGLPYGPGFQQPTPLPTPKAGQQPMPLPSNKPVMGTPGFQSGLGNPTIGMPAGPGFMPTGGAQFPGTKPTVDPQLRVPQPQTMQQIRSQVGIRPTSARPVARPSLPASRTPTVYKPRGY